MSTMPMVYIAGPITSDVMGGARRAMQVGTELLRRGFAPYLPQLSVYWEISFGPIDYERWLALDFAIIARCNALVRLPGESPGADSEVAEAKRLLIPVFELYPGDTLTPDLKAWGRRWLTVAE